MADARIVQKDEIPVVCSVRPDLTRKRDLHIALLPDCAALRSRARVAQK
jgi:hypothetical protein